MSQENSRAEAPRAEDSTRVESADQASLTRAVSSEASARRGPRAGKWTLLLVALLVPVLPFLVLGELPGKEWVQGAAAGWVGPTGALVLAADVFLPIPSTIVGSYLGYALGAGAGFFWGWLGLCVGNLIGWAFGRVSLSFLGTELGGAPSGLLLLATRPLPILAEAMLIATGAARVPLRQVVAPILLGNAAFALALALSGAALSGPGWSVEWLAVPLGLPLVGLWLARRWRKRSG